MVSLISEERMYKIAKQVDRSFAIASVEAHKLSNDLYRDVDNQVNAEIVSGYIPGMR